jgi:hypothetical protein
VILLAPWGSLVGPTLGRLAISGQHKGPVLRMSHRGLRQVIVRQAKAELGLLVIFCSLVVLGPLPIRNSPAGIKIISGSKGCLGMRGLSPSFSAAFSAGALCSSSWTDQGGGVTRAYESGTQRCEPIQRVGYPSPFTRPPVLSLGRI